LDGHLRCSSDGIVFIQFNNCLPRSFERERHNEAVADGAVQGWHADPSGLHEMRYFSAGQPTKLVRDGRLESYDEPPTDGMAAWSTAGSGDLPELAGAGSATASYAADDARRAAVASYARRRRRRLEYPVVAAGAVIAVLTFVAFVGGSPAARITSAAFVTKAEPRPFRSLASKAPA
jgi:hypothetical protein